MPSVITSINPLNTNLVYGALYNMVISQECFGSPVKNTYSQLVDRARIDVGLYGDQKWFYSTDVLGSYKFNVDTPDQLNVLATHRPKAPEVQNIVIDQFFQIAITLDEFQSKMAWGSEGAFSQFNSVMMGMIADTKRIIDSTTYNTFIGTNETDIGEQQRTINLVDGQNKALTIAVDLANLLTEIKDISRQFNDYGFIRSYDESDLIVIFNAQYRNSLTKLDMPQVFHTQGLLNEFEKVNLPARYFGTIVGDNHTQMTIPKDGLKTYRTLVERDIVRDGETIHLFGADKLEAGDVVYEDETYMEDKTIAYKVMHKRSVPYMSAFTTSTTFKNAKNLSTNFYTTFGRNTLEHLKNFPFITARTNG